MVRCIEITGRHIMIEQYDIFHSHVVESLFISTPVKETLETSSSKITELTLNLIVDGIVEVHFRSNIFNINYLLHTFDTATGEEDRCHQQ